VVDHDVVDRLACRMIAGGANDTLADEACAAALAARGITYVPDFIANAGGVIHIHGLRSGWDDRRLTEEITAIGDRVASVLQDAADFGHTSLEAARGIAERRLRPGARDGAVQAA
jgi:leucine dehydrogenase